MLRYAVRALPRGRIAAAACLVVLLMETVGRWPGPTWALQGAAVGLMAGAAAWCLDEPAARVVDTCPRGLGWRTSARLPGPLMLAGLWAAVVGHVRPSLGGRAQEVLLQGLAAMLLGLAWTTWLRARGEAVPGLAFAAFVIPVALGIALTQPLVDDVPVFPGLWADLAAWRWSTAGWFTAGLLAVVLLLAALADAPWWRIRRLS